MMDFWKGTVTPKDWVAVGIIIGSAIFLGAAFYVFVYGGQARAHDELVAENRQVAARLEMALETQRNIGALRAKAEQMQQLVEQFEDRLPNTEEIQALLRQFEHFAGEIGLRVELSKLSPVGDAKKEIIPYNITARGTFHQIATFINRLERYERYLKISELNMSKADGGLATASFRLSTFRFKQPSEDGTS